MQPLRHRYNNPNIDAAAVTLPTATATPLPTSRRRPESRPMGIAPTIPADARPTGPVRQDGREPDATAAAEPRAQGKPGLDATALEVTLAPAEPSAAACVDQGGGIARSSNSGDSVPRCRRDYLSRAHPQRRRRHRPWRQPQEDRWKAHGDGIGPGNPPRGSTSSLQRPRRRDQRQNSPRRRTSPSASADP